MNLKAILEDFDSKIVQRGKKYFLDGLVTELYEVEKHCFEAEVEGTEDYSVSVMLSEEEDELLECDCDCPYDGGYGCKHIVAVLYAIQEYRTGRENSKKKSSYNPISTDQFKQLSKDELVSLISEMMERYPEIKKWMRVRMDKTSNPIEYYQKVIKISMDSAKDKDRGFVLYEDIIKAAKGLEETLEYLESILDTEDLQQIYCFVKMIMKNSIQLMMEGDDSEGYAENICIRCAELLQKVIQERIDETDVSAGKEVYYVLMDLLHMESMLNTDDCCDMLEEMCEYLAERIELLRDEMIEYYQEQVMESMYQYQKRDACKNVYRLVKKWKGEVAGIQYLSKYVAYDEFQDAIYEIAIEEEKYEDAVKICEANEAKKEEIYQKKRWQERRYEIYKKTHQIEKQRSLAEEFVLDNDCQYCKDLKALYPEEIWKIKYEQLVEKLAGTEYKQAYIRLISQEKDELRILQYIEDVPDQILNYYEILMPHYRDRVQEAFLFKLNEMTLYTATRTYYQEICQKMKIYEKLFGEKAVMELLESFRENYKRRTAFIEELNKFWPKKS